LIWARALNQGSPKTQGQKLPELPFIFGISMGKSRVGGWVKIPIYPKRGKQAPGVTKLRSPKRFLNSKGGNRGRLGVCAKDTTQGGWRLKGRTIPFKGKGVERFTWGQSGVLGARKYNGGQKFWDTPGRLC